MGENSFETPFYLADGIHRKGEILRKKARISPKRCRAGVRSPTEEILYHSFAFAGVERQSDAFDHEVLHYFAQYDY